MKVNFSGLFFPAPKEEEKVVNLTTLEAVTPDNYSEVAICDTVLLNTHNSVITAVIVAEKVIDGDKFLLFYTSKGFCAFEVNMGGPVSNSDVKIWITLIQIPTDLVAQDIALESVNIAISKLSTTSHYIFDDVVL